MLYYNITWLTIRHMFMKSNFFLQVIIFLFCIHFSIPAQANEISHVEAQTWVEEKGRQLLLAFGEQDITKKYSTLDNMLLNYIDLEYVSRFVVGKYWRQMSNEQQFEYTSLFKRYALSVYKSFPLSFDGKSIDFKVINVIPEKQKATVRTKININTENKEQVPVSDIVVDFRLDKKDDNIKIIDLKLGESSLILSYRSRFYEMIRNCDDDLVWFLEDLHDITKAAERTNQETLRLAEY